MFLLDLKNSLEQKYPGVMGRLYLIFLSTFSPILFICVHKLQTITPTEAGYIRGLINSIVGYRLIIAKGIEVHPKNETSIKACIMVFSLGSVAFVLMFVASELVSVSQMTVLFQTSSIWVFILGIFILKDALNFVQTSSIILSFLGVILIVNPSILSLDNKGALSDIAEDNTNYT